MRGCFFDFGKFFCDGAVALAFVSCFIAVSVIFPKCFAGEPASLSVERALAPSGRNYLIVHPKSCRFDFCTNRPNRDDANILLCIPAAFTAQDGGLCGLYAVRGEVANEKMVDRKIGGAIQFQATACKIFDTNSGANLDAAFVSKLKESKSSFFQQFQVVKDKHAESFKDKTHFQRRCIASFSNGEFAVVESDDSITFQEFGEDLVGLGVQDAVYTDMGPWSEGWYRDKDGRIVTLGKSRMLTNRQTNWVVIEKE